MSRDLTKLDKDFQAKIQVLIENCQKRGIKVVPYFAVRTPQEQGRLWRQGRTTRTINAKVRELKALGCGFLAKCIEEAGPQQGNVVTNALPGQSWHQWGYACDFYWEKTKGNVCWSTNEKDANGLNGYQVLQEEARKIGLYGVTLGNGVVDWPHVQCVSGSPKDIVAINEEMEKRFG